MAGSVISKFWGVYLNDFLRLMGVNFNTNIMIGSFHLDIAPIVIVAFFTTLLVLGTKIGARVDGAMTVLKIAVVLFVVIVGFFYVKASNYTPFIPPAEPSADVANATTVHGPGPTAVPVAYAYEPDHLRCSRHHLGCCTRVLRLHRL